MKKTFKHPALELVWFHGFQLYRVEIQNFSADMGNLPCSPAGGDVALHTIASHHAFRPERRLVRDEEKWSEPFRSKLVDAWIDHVKQNPEFWHVDDDFWKCSYEEVSDYFENTSVNLNGYIHDKEKYPNGCSFERFLIDLQEKVA